MGKKLGKTEVTKNEIKVGDVVRLKNGGSKMTVDGINAGRPFVVFGTTNLVVT